MEFNAQVLKGLNVKLSKHKIKNRTYKLPTNPFSEKGDPVILLPKDIVRKLPVILDYSDISDTIDHNISLRSKVNKDVGGIWSGMTKKEKRKLRDAVLRNKKNFNILLEVIKKTKKNSYDFTMDKEGEFFWKEAAARAASSYPLNLAQFSEKTPKRNDVVEMVREIVEQYRFLVEHKGMWRDFWINEKVHRNEKAAQRLFYGIADSYCKANNLLITPEAETGTGPVDFKITGNKQSEVLVEIKLSTNDVSKGYEIQLETYKVSENTDEAFFVVIDLGISGEKWRKKLDAAQARMKKNGKSLSELYTVDASHQVSASRRSRSSSRKIDDDE